MKRPHRGPKFLSPTCPSSRGLGRYGWGIRPSHLLSVLTVAALAGGCQTEPDRQLGTTLDGRALPVTAGDPSGEPFFVSEGAFVGRWVGSAEDPLALGGERSSYVFPSGSIAITLQLKAPAAEGDSLHGSIVFGTGTPPPAPTDPNVGYPADVDYVALSYFDRSPLFGATPYVGPLPPYEGFEYRVLPAVYLNELNSSGLADGLLRLSYDTHEVLGPWCELQQPARQSNGTHSCAAAVDSGRIESDGSCVVETSNNLNELLAGLSDAELIALDSEGWAEIERQTVRETEPIDCNKLFLCATGRCVCDEESCHADVSEFTAITAVRPTSYSYAELTLRASADGDGLIGIFTNAAFSNERRMSVPVGVVHFQRAD